MIIPKLITKNQAQKFVISSWNFEGSFWEDKSLILDLPDPKRKVSMHPTNNTTESPY
jgi:hypothetical protein